MMMKTIQMVRLLAASVMGLCLLTGCMENAKTQMDYTEEELPYGATMRQMKEGFAVPITYDRRFLNEEQVAAVANYMSAVETSDAELYRQSTVDFYAEYQLNEVYQEQYSSMDELVGDLHDSIVERTAADFRFDMITIADYTTEANVSGLNVAVELLNEISEEEDFRSHIDGCWALTVDWLISYSGGDPLLAEGNSLYLLEIDGKYYCMT